MAASMDDGLPTDVLVEVLLRLPPNSRRRFRLVCRLWRDAVDQRTATDLRSRANTLLVAHGSAYVLDDQWRIRRVLAAGANDGHRVAVVGTCNGIICVCNDGKAPGAVALANPATGGKLALPPLLRAADISTHRRQPWHLAYSFAHHQATGRYAVVHVPCCFDRVWEFHTVRVFTLGEASWRDVVAGGGARRCSLAEGIVSVDGATYWVAEGGNGEIVSFDLGDERVSTINPPPVPARPGSSYRSLAEVRGRLGVAIIHDSPAMKKTDVWVLEDARGSGRRWSRWYSVERSVPKPPQHRWVWQQLALPHFTHSAGDGDGEHIGERRSRHGVVRIDGSSQGTVFGKGYICGAFAHVQTREPLSVYRLW